MGLLIWQGGGKEKGGKIISMRRSNGQNDRTLVGSKGYNIQSKYFVDAFNHANPK
jgi:hypothetical protein